MPCFLSVLGFNMEEYKTVEKFGEDFFIEKKSKFIGYACPVKSRQEADDFISKIKTKHWDATHNVYAYVLRENNIQRYSDDGEPSGTAGVPVLDVILKEGLVDVCVVATRYFGGTLLGAGGLVRAYSHTSKIGLEAAGIITMAQCSIMSVKVDYSFYDRLLLFLSDNGCNIIDTQFSDYVCVTFSLKADGVEKLNENLMDLSNGRYSAQYISTEFAKI